MPKKILWSAEIRDLGKDFFVEKQTVEKIIKSVRQKYRGKDNEYKYDRAYSMLKPHIYAKLV